MNRWSTKPLGDLIAVEKGKKAPITTAVPTATSLRYLQIEDLRPDANIKYCEPFSCPIANEADVIIAWDGANAGTVSCHLEGYIGSTLAILRPTSAHIISAAFLARFLEGRFKYLQETATGATVPHISRSALNALQVPLPPLSDQERIVQLLDDADELRKLRVQADRRTADLVPALFHEMFGDPRSNPREWRVGLLGDVISSAKDGPHLSPKYTESGIPFLSTRNVRAGKLVWDDLKYVSPEEAKIHWRKCRPQRGDVLYTKGGTTGLSKAVDFDDEFAVWVHVAVLKPRRNMVDPVWLESMLNTEYCYLQSQQLTHGITNRDLGLTRMVKIQLFVPPLTLQSEFVSRIADIRELETKQEMGRRRLDELYQSMLHHAFNGEL